MEPYHQLLDPLENTHIFGIDVPWTALWSTILAAIPIIVLFWLLVPMRWLASRAGAAGALTAIVIAILIFGMPWDQALWSFGYGVAFGLLPVGWTIFAAMLLYNITVETGQFTIVKRSVASLSGDARIQAILIGFAFGAFLEGAAGGGTPVAICGAIMVGLGFDPFLAAVLCLIANTSPVAYGGLGTPILVLNGVTDIKGETLSTMAGHQLPIMSLIVPAYMVKCMCSWKKTFEVWPALVVAGGSFAIFQYVFATMHDYLPGVVLYPMTDIGGGIFCLIVTAVFLKFWKPKEEWHFTTPTDAAFSTTNPAAITAQSPSAVTDAAPTPAPQVALDPNDPHAAEAMAMMGGESKQASENDTKPLTFGNVTLAWMPYILMSVLLMLTGIVREKEGKWKYDTWLENPVKAELDGVGPIYIPCTRIQTNYLIEIPTLHKQVMRDKELGNKPVEVRATDAGTVARVHVKAGSLVKQGDLLAEINTADRGIVQVHAPAHAWIETIVAERTSAETNTILFSYIRDERERALFNFAWLTAPGTAVFVAALISMLFLRMTGAQIWRVFKRTFAQMKIPIPTIAFMIGLSYVTRYAGMDATLGYAFAYTGPLYPFFAPILGWLGVFLTGTDAGSNALFGSLQKITAQQVHGAGAFGADGLTVGQAEVLICTSNSTGGVMGKMIDAQSICVATAATHQLGKEADIFKAVVWHSIILASVIGVMTLLQAYVYPFTLMVPDHTLCPRLRFVPDATYSGKGVRIDRVEPGGPADVAGLKKGDVITEAAGAAILSLDQYRGQRAAFEAGKAIEIKYLRERNEASARPVPR